MNTPEWLKPGLYGALIGAVLFGVIGFIWGGWVTVGTANERADAMSRDNVVVALVPVCLDRAGADAGREAKLETIRVASSFRKGDALMATGWATAPGADAPDKDLARACLTAIDL